MSRAAALAAAMCRRSPNAKDVRYDGETSRGPIDIEDREESDAGGLRLVRRTIITVPAGALPSLTKSALPATVRVEPDTTDEQSYTVRDWQLVEDGELKELICAEVTD